KMPEFWTRNLPVEKYGCSNQLNSPKTGTPLPTSDSPSGKWSIISFAFWKQAARAQLPNFWLRWAARLKRPANWRIGSIRYVSARNVQQKHFRITVWCRAGQKCHGWREKARSRVKNNLQCSARNNLLQLPIKNML